jgi:hypothetical protein
VMPKLLLTLTFFVLSCVSCRPMLPFCKLRHSFFYFPKYCRLKVERHSTADFSEARQAIWKMTVLDAHDSISKSRFSGWIRQSAHQILILPSVAGNISCLGNEKKKVGKWQHNIVTVSHKINHVNVWSVQKSSKFSISGLGLFLLV